MRKPGSNTAALVFRLHAAQCLENVLWAMSMYGTVFSSVYPCSIDCGCLLTVVIVMLPVECRHTYMMARY